MTIKIKKVLPEKNTDKKKNKNYRIISESHIPKTYFFVCM